MVISVAETQFKLCQPTSVVLGINLFNSSNADLYEKTVKSLSQLPHTRAVSTTTYHKDFGDKFAGKQLKIQTNITYPKGKYYVDIARFNKVSPTTCRAMSQYSFESVGQAMTTFGQVAYTGDKYVWIYKDTPIVFGVASGWAELDKAVANVAMKDTVCDICGKRDGRRRVLHLVAECSSDDASEIKKVKGVCQNCFDKGIAGQLDRPLFTPYAFSTLFTINRVIEEMQQAGMDVNKLPAGNDYLYSIREVSADDIRTFFSTAREKLGSDDILNKEDYGFELLTSLSGHTIASSNAQRTMVFSFNDADNLRIRVTTEDVQGVLYVATIDSSGAVELEPDVDEKAVPSIAKLASLFSSWWTSRPMA